MYIAFIFGRRKYMNNIDAKPFLKWAGGKRQLIDQYNKLFPERLLVGQLTTYIEPFLGGGAVFFELIKRFDFKMIILNDINEDLILTYRVIQQNVNSVIKELSFLEDRYLSANNNTRKKMYYEIRDLFNAEKEKVNHEIINDIAIRHAARLIFLNRTCFNGLYRLNNKGEFNVPQGNYKNPQILDSENLYNVSNALKNVILLCGDFEQIYPYVDENTFVYMDPPYRPLPKTPSFTSYAKQDFNEDCQIRLSKFFRKLDEKNASIMLSNSNPKNTDPYDNFFEIYYESYDIFEVSANRAINSDSSKRGAITELVIKNKR